MPSGRATFPTTNCLQSLWPSLLCPYAGRATAGGGNRLGSGDDSVLALMKSVITSANFRVIPGLRRGLSKWIWTGSSEHGDPSALRAGIQVSRTAEDHSLRQTRMIIGSVPCSDRGEHRDTGRHETIDKGIG